MQLNSDDIESFKDIYRQEFGEELSDADAERRAIQFFTFFEIIYRIYVNDTSAPRDSTLDQPDGTRKVSSEDGASASTSPDPSTPDRD